MTELEALRRLYEAATTITRVAPVDDDFPEVMHNFQSALRRIREVEEDGTETTGFVEAWDEKASEVNKIAKSKGWWDAERNDGEVIALMHSELSEDLEALRHGNGADDHIPEFLGTEAEMADVVIRIMDYGKARDLRIAEAIEAKIAYNAKRERKHGGKAF